MHIQALLAASCFSIVVTIIGASIMSRSRRCIPARADGRAIGGPALVCGIITAAVIAGIDARLIATAGLVALIGLTDDLIDLSPWQKLAGQTIAAAIAARCNCRRRM